MRRLQDQHERLQHAVQDPEVCLGYLPGTRLYFIYRIFGSLADEAVMFGPENQYFEGEKMMIAYCPWSGTTLPGDLEFARSRTLSMERDISQEEILDSLGVHRLLRGEWVTEEWWVKREITTRAQPLSSPTSWKQGDYTVWYRDVDNRQIPPGKYRSVEAPPHLCESMADAFDHIGWMITYIPWTREYGIRRLARDRWVDHQPIRMIKIDYCPWCGTKLPSGLKQAWYDELEERGIDPNADDKPSMLLSDEWWRLKGL